MHPGQFCLSAANVVVRSDLRQETMKRCHLEALRAHLGLLNAIPKQAPCESPIPKDVILTALDTEGPSTTISELGIATLSTTPLATTPPGLKANTWCKQILARHFNVGPKATGHRNRFSFGRTEHIPSSAIHPYLSSLLQPPQPHILIGHSLDKDLAKLSSLAGCDISLLPNVIGVIDTLDLVRDMPLPQKLSELWKHLGGGVRDSAINFHNAGNDAVCNLQVLLMLAIMPEERWVTPGPGMPYMGALAPFQRTIFAVDGAEASSTGSFRLRMQVRDVSSVMGEGDGCGACTRGTSQSSQQSAKG